MATKQPYRNKETGTIVAAYLREVCNTKKTLEFYPENYGLTLGTLRMMLYNGAAYAAEHLGCEDEWKKCSIEKHQISVRLVYAPGSKLSRETPIAIEDDKTKIDKLRNGPAGVKLTLLGPITSTRKKKLHEFIKELPLGDYVYVIKPNQAIIIKLRDECRNTVADVSGQTGEADGRRTQEDISAISKPNPEEPIT